MNLTLAQSRPTTIAVWAIVAGLCVFWILQSFQATVASYVNIPYWDQWDNLTVPFSFHDLFRQHNENRIGLARLIFAIDTLAFHGADVFAITCATLLQLSTCAVLCGMIFFSQDIRPLEKALLILLAVLFCFWWYQEENLHWGFQSQYTGVVSFSIAAFAVFALNPDRWRNAIAATALFAIASAGLSNGMVAGAVVLLGSLIFRSRPAIVVFIFAALTAIATLYLTDYHPPQTVAGPQSPLRLMFYPFVYIGAPLRFLLTWSSLSPVRSALAMGVILAAALCIVAPGLYRRRRNLPAIDKFAVLIVIFILVTSCMVSIARASYFGLEQAISSRYLTMLVPFYVAVAILNVRAWQFTEKRFAHILALVALCFVPIVTQHAFVEEAQARSLSLKTGTTALLSQVNDKDALMKLYPDPAFPVRKAAELRKERRSIYSEQWPAWLGKPLSETGFVWSPYCAGHVDTAADNRATGWAFNIKYHRPAEVILLTDPDDVVVGFGLSGTARPDVSRQVKTPLTVGWQGHFQGTVKPRGVAVFLSSGELCRF